MLVKGSKIKLKIAMPGMEKFGFKVGTQFNVDDICGDMLILSIPEVGRGFMSLSEYVAFFEEVKEPRQWTKWKRVSVVKDPRGGYDHDVFFKTNYRTVIVKICRKSSSTDGSIPAYVKGRASCHGTDNFNLETGVQLAFARANKKFVEKRMTE